MTRAIYGEEGPPYARKDDWSTKDPHSKLPFSRFVGQEGHDLRHIWSSASLKASPFCWWVTSSLELFVPPLVSGLTRAKGLIWRIEVVHGGLNACWLPFFGVLKACATPTLLKSPLRRIQTAGKCLFVDLSSSMPRIWILRHRDSDTFWLNQKKAIESRKLGDIILLTIPVFRFGSTAQVPGKPSTPRWSPISARSERSRWGALSLVGSSVWITGFLEVGSNWSSQLWELYIYCILYI